MNDDILNEILDKARTATPQGTRDAALQLRKEAYRMLKEAQEMDQLRPFPVVHQGQLGAHAFIVWAQERPSTSDVTLILQSHVKEVTEEDVTVHPCLAQDEVASIAFHTRLPDWLCDRSTAEREWR